MAWGVRSSKRTLGLMDPWCMIEAGCSGPFPKPGLQPWPLSWGWGAPPPALPARLCVATLISFFSPLCSSLFIFGLSFKKPHLFFHLVDLSFTFSSLPCSFVLSSPLPAVSVFSLHLL